MALRKSSGNMYPWCGFMHSHLRGRCPHGCSYCYVQAHERRWGTGAFAGVLRCRESEFAVNYGSGKTIFIEHQNDLFAEDVHEAIVDRVLRHCSSYPENVYVFQTKNPARVPQFARRLPPIRFLGATIESDLHHSRVMGAAPSPSQRLVSCFGFDFITIEPVLAFSPAFAARISGAAPKWVNIGADSKGHNLPEPLAEDLREFIAGLGARGVRILNKSNLGRILGEPQERREV
ncbi:MAG: DUF5131 family protein [Planctomycetota bacterium]